MASSRARWWGRAAAVAGLLLVGLWIQVHFLRHYPQPILFGDPAGYFKVGQRFQEALRQWHGGESWAAVFERARGSLYLLGVGTVFAVLDGLRPQDWAFFRLVFAGFNTLAMLGCFCLGRRLSGSFAGGLLALGVAAAYPSFSVQIGRLYPDPLTGCAFVWAAFFYAEALARGSRRWMAAAGLVFGAGVFLRAQLMNYILMVLVAVLGATAWAWLRRQADRRLIAAFLLGFLPWAVAWGGVVRAAGDRDDVVQLGNATFRPLYPYGFWQFLETDGWIGPYRFKQEPYYRAMEAEARDTGDLDLLRSRPRQWAFTVRYVAARPWESLLLVFDNAYRLYDRPANDYKWDYPFSYPWQVGLQRVIVILALVGIVVLAGDGPARLGVLLLPVSLAVLHGLVFPWPRYNLPAMPILVAVGAAAAVRSVQSGPRSWRIAAGVLACGGAFLGAGRLAFLWWPEASRVASWAGLLLVLACPFVHVAARGSRGRRALASGVFAVLGILVTAHQIRSPAWHEVATEIGTGAVWGVEQEIALTPDALERLRGSSEVLAVFDLKVPRGDLRDVLVEINGRGLPGTALVATMPRLPESTSTGGRDWRGYPQWWALAITPDLLPPTAAEPLRIRITSSGPSPLILGGDRFAAQQTTYEGPSFGDWTKVVPLKLEYDGDYRIPVRRQLASQQTVSYVLGRDGGRRAVAQVHRIRVVTLAANEGSLEWVSAALPKAPRVALAFGAYSGMRGRAEIEVGGGTGLEFPLGSRDDFVVEAGEYRLCHKALGVRQDKPYGHYVVLAPGGEPGHPVALRVRFRTGMSLERKFFVLDRKAAPEDLARAADACAGASAAPLVEGVAQVLDGSRNNYPEDFGPWEVARVY